MSINIVRTGQKYPYKDKNALKEKIFEICLENQERAKDLYDKLIPETTDGSNLNLIIANSDLGIKCINAVTDTADKLIKFYSEINKSDLVSKENTGVAVNGVDLYKVMEQHNIKPEYTDNAIESNVIPKDENEMNLKFEDISDEDNPFNTEQPIEIEEGEKIEKNEINSN